ncbi:MAG: ATPase [Thermoprotei archaeon]|nr:MAG: ATPase [Thermoprotei archaeon]
MPPVLLNKPVEMVKANILTPKTYVDKLLSILHEEGALHITKIGKGIEEYIVKLQKINDINNKIDYILSFKTGAVLDISLTLYELRQISMDIIEKDVNKIYLEVKGLEDNIEEYKNELSKLTNIYDVTKHLPQDFETKYIFYKGKYLSIITAYGKSDNIKEFVLENKITLLYSKFMEERAVAIMIIEVSKLKSLLRKLALSGLKYLHIDNNLVDKYTKIKELNDYLSTRINELRDKINELKDKINKIVSRSLSDLGKYKVIIENMSYKIEALLNIATSKYLLLISGWIPKNKSDKLINRLKTENIPVYIEYNPPSIEDEPPTLLENPKIIRYYEPIVKFLGVPNYHEWDPTPVVAYSFALFYGIMLGDMGYAIAIILAAYLILDKFVVDVYSRDYQFFKRSIVISSIVGFIIGALSGALFGDILEIARLKYMITNIFNDPLMFLTVSIIIGLIHVNIAHAIALVKYLKRKNVGDVISETGLFVAEIFGIPYIMYTMLNIPIPIIPQHILQYFIWFALAGVALIIIGMIKSIGGLGILMWLFNITGLLGDVLSYSRLAGVGLATIYLASSFNLMAKMIYNGIIGMLPQIIAPIIAFIPAMLVALFGHFINTALSALGSFIHSLRLCFVEFLSKFYEGNGYLFNPFRIILRKRIIIE